MRILRWLLEKRDKSAAPVVAEPTPAGSDNGELTPAAETPQLSLVDPESDNLRRWRESGQARAWVEAQRGQWDHDAWLALLDELKRSPFWPMRVEAVGMTLEEIRREAFRAPMV